MGACVAPLWSMVHAVHYPSQLQTDGSQPCQPFEVKMGVLLAPWEWSAAGAEAGGRSAPMPKCTITDTSTRF